MRDRYLEVPTPHQHDIFRQLRALTQASIVPRRFATGKSPGLASDMSWLLADTK